MKSSSGFVRALVTALRSAIGSAIFVAIAFLGAWRLDWDRGWIYAVVFIGFSVAGALIVDRANPDLLDARAKGMRKETKAFDKLFYLMFLPLIVGYPLVAGLDAGRFFWAPLPGWTVWPGILLFAVASIFGTWVLVTNRHAEGTVRIQEDRSHVVVTGGPYAYVRHPMYLGTLIGFPAAALILGSAWAFVPMVLLVVIFVWRTANEDRTLFSELEGYADYAAKTRFRLVPGLW